MPLATAAGKERRKEGEGGLASYPGYRVHLATGTAPFPSPDCLNPSVRYPVHALLMSHATPPRPVPGLFLPSYPTIGHT